MYTQSLKQTLTTLLNMLWLETTTKKNLFFLGIYQYIVYAGLQSKSLICNLDIS